ncbi:MAG: CRISPR system precrRNA processing endoribonuclease RAMP protein Cas6 [Firmicutes bacterium]|nr:CRISPR system precrRNA processing endoribonuclease RAMP protein Cas6 [Bacillota bacterium]
MECPVKEKCAYTLIFAPVGISSAKRLQNVPRGYVLKPPLEEETEYSSGKPLSFNIVLVGDRVNYLAYVIVALKELGRSGIGLNRGKFTLGEISVIKNGTAEAIYDPSLNTVKNVDKRTTGIELLEQTKKINQRKITIQFLTPARIKYNPTGEKGKSAVVRVPEFHHIIRRLRDRINALSMAYCSSPVDIDFKGIAERATAVKTRDVNLKWLDLKRKSKTQQIQHDQSGFIGRITYEGDLDEFLPLIVLGEHVHVGEDAVFGNGWYRVQ